MCYVIDFSRKVQTESSTCLEVLIKTSPLGLYYDTVNIIDDFLDSLKHFCGKVHVRTTVSKKEFGCAVLICIKNRAGECMHYTTVFHVKSQQNIDFLQSVLHHIESLCMELYQITDIDSDADVESKME